MEDIEKVEENSLGKMEDIRGAYREQLKDNLTSYFCIVVRIRIYVLKAKSHDIKG